jgi:hypothetical protein
MTWEIYSTPLNNSFIGHKFSDISCYLYNKYGIVLFGLKISDSLKRVSNLVLNPKNFIIPTFDLYSIEVGALHTLHSCDEQSV